MKTDVMFDTNIFSHFLQNKIPPEILPIIVERLNVYVTHIQKDELCNTSDDALRLKLLSLFSEITEKSIATESSVWNISRWDESKLSASDSAYIVICGKLDELKKSPNNQKDALIAETAIKNNLVLVTHDSNLLQVITELGGSATDIFTLLGIPKTLIGPLLSQGPAKD